MRGVWRDVDSEPAKCIVEAFVLDADRASLNLDDAATYANTGYAWNIAKEIKLLSVGFA